MRETMDKQVVTLPDGRKLVSYTFGPKEAQQA